MDGLHFEDAVRAPHNNTMQQHLNQKLGKPTEFGLKTPSRGGLGLLVNESKTPGAKSMQGMASARKMTSSVRKPIPYDDEYEVFQDEIDEGTPIRSIQAEKPTCCSPIDTVDRYETSDSLADDIADDLLNWNDRSVVLTEELPIPDDCIDPELSEQEALAALGVEEWDEYPPIEPASRIADDFDYPFRIEEFRCEDVKLEEGEYPEMFDNREGLGIDREYMKILLEELDEKLKDVDIEDLLLAERNAIFD